MVLLTEQQRYFPSLLKGNNQQAPHGSNKDCEIANMYAEIIVR
jgi:hypothetical protein